MRVRVLFFGMLRELAGKSGETLELPQGARVRDLLAHYELARDENDRQLSRMKEALTSVAIAVNQEYAARETILQAEDEVALLPPVSGGSGSRRGPRWTAEGGCPHIERRPQ